MGRRRQRPEWKRALSSFTCMGVYFTGAPTPSASQGDLEMSTPSSVFQDHTDTATVRAVSSAGAGVGRSAPCSPACHGGLTRARRFPVVMEGHKGNQKGSLREVEEGRRLSTGIKHVQGSRRRRRSRDDSPVLLVPEVLVSQSFSTYQQTVQEGPRGLVRSRSPLLQVQGLYQGRPCRPRSRCGPTPGRTSQATRRTLFPQVLHPSALSWQQQRPCSTTAAGFRTSLPFRDRAAALRSSGVALGLLRLLLNHSLQEHV